MKKVYVAEYRAMYKIGVSENVEKRMKQLSCGCPGIICVYKSPFLNNGYQVENELHNKFKTYCVGGEWFTDVDFSVIENIVNAKGDKQRPVKRDVNMEKVDFETFASGIFSINGLRQEVEQIRSENEQLEKFSLAVNGVDVPNIYSDLIYDILFGKDTEQFIKEYKPRKYESFRNYLPDKQNDKIEALMKVVIGLIGLNWKIEEIKDFIMDI